MDRTGLGQGQTLRLAKLLGPDKVLLIDSTFFNGNPQYPEWYKGYKTEMIYGFPNDREVTEFLEGLDTVITCETWYNNHFVEIARAKGVKTILIFNYEFLDNLNNPRLPIANKMIQPSYWYLDQMKSRYGAEYLPTPIFKDEFKRARKANLKRKGKPKYLFMNGKTAVHDRNGLESLYAALHLAKGDFTVTVKAQHDIKQHPDPRLIYDFSNPEDQAELYTDFDALIQPRRYGGQTLSMTEALMSALPVFMTDIDPNNKVLPKEWLVPAYKVNSFMTRTMIDVYSAERVDLAKLLDTFEPTRESKERAFEIGQQFEAETLRSKYKELLK